MMCHPVHVGFQFAILDWLTFFFVGDLRRLIWNVVKIVSLRTQILTYQITCQMVKNCSAPRNNPLTWDPHFRTPTSVLSGKGLAGFLSPIWFLDPSSSLSMLGCVCSWMPFLLPEMDHQNQILHPLSKSYFFSMASLFGPLWATSYQLAFGDMYI